MRLVGAFGIRPGRSHTSTPIEPKGRTMFESFLDIHAGDEDLIRPVLEHFLGELPDVEITGLALEPAQQWSRAGQTPRNRLGAEYHRARALEHLSLYLHLTRVDTVSIDITPDLSKLRVPLAGDPAQAIADAAGAQGAPQ